MRRFVLGSRALVSAQLSLCLLWLPACGGLSTPLHCLMDGLLAKHGQLVQSAVQLSCFREKTRTRPNAKRWDISNAEQGVEITPIMISMWVDRRGAERQLS